MMPQIQCQPVALLWNTNQGGGAWIGEVPQDDNLDALIDDNKNVPTAD